MADARLEPRSETEALRCAFRAIVYRREAADTARIALGCDNAEVKKMAGLKREGSLEVDVSTCRLCRFYKVGAPAPKKKPVAPAENDDLSWLLSLGDED